MSTDEIAAAFKNVDVPWIGDGILWLRAAVEPTRRPPRSKPLIHSAPPAPIV